MRTKKLQDLLNSARLLFAYLMLSHAIPITSGIYFAYRVIPDFKGQFLPWLLISLLASVLNFILYIVSVVGIIRNSTQVGIVTKTVVYFWGWIWPFDLYILPKIIKTAKEEARFENSKIITNEKRAPYRICQTKYPILMVHGVFFRDFKPAFLNYWGRIAPELQQNGATIYFGNQQSAASVEECGREIAIRIKQIVEQTGCEKVNVIAHSKGGLDTRAAIARYGADEYVASLTTINTPHRGCEFADFLLDKIGQGFKDKVANTYNSALKRIGDPNPNFIEAVTDLTHSACAEFNNRTPDSPKVYYQSVGSYMGKASGGRFPLNFSYHLVKYFDGRNDGLVGEKSFSWGSNFTFLNPPCNRGISHGDMIDLNRENIPGFDVREFYVQLVSNLKQLGF
ncbi:esterase/lipase family protein [Butyrivibrio sp. INlla14]|uniref:esterase/lipase family protein n=1 Tax=Butyrivibrio sp. INlla14 TaxID=1520808 RepID=UPI000876DDF1|nr:alpha/beta fold hydrolase [Butyrivibrio sp. INlla14]SCY70792.1 triacylglycerol lipase [Butyrivibrio sp. INlla14]